MLSRTLISTQMLASHLQDPAVVVIDCRFKLDDDRWGGREYTSRHIPGAVYAHLNDVNTPQPGEAYGPFWFRSVLGLDL